MANRHDEAADDCSEKREKTAMQELDEYLNNPKNQLFQFIDNVTRRVKVAHDETKQLSEKYERKLEHVRKENEVIQKRLTESEKTRERYRQERSDLRTQIEKFSQEVKHSGFYEKDEQLRRELEELRNVYEKKEKEWERKLKESEDSSDEIIRVQKQKIEQMELELKKQAMKIKSLEELMESTKFSFSDTGKLRKKLEDSEKQLNDTNDKLFRVSSKLKETEIELDDTKTRLSKAMGDKLTDNNPSIADLSDKNRPTKLAEKYAELYDNQWTDAFEQIQVEVYSDNDEDIINILLHILLDISDFCNQKANKQLNDLKKVLLYSDSMTDGNVPGNVTKQLKDCRKATSSLSKDRVYELYLSGLRKERGQLKYALKISSFVKECVEICWLMVNQDPPVVFGPTVEHGEELNTDVFKAYLRNGPYVDFVVWPAMFLHKGGPVLAKGVAEGYGHKIQRRKEGWADEVSTKVSRVTQITLGDQDTGYVYDQGKRPYDITPITKAYGSPTQIYQDARIPSSEYTKYSHKDSHQRTRSADEPRRTYTKATKFSYEREPSVQEMKTFFRYYDRCDYIGARNVLGDQVYERCRRNAYKRYKYY